MEYLKYISDIGYIAPNRKLLCVESNFIIEITVVTHDRHSKNDVMNWWVRFGYVPYFMNEHISLRTYCTDNYGRCSEKFNPQVTKDNLIDFTYILENTPENEQYLVNECIRRYKEEN